VDRHARSCLPSGRSGPSVLAYGWQPLSPAEPDRFSCILHYLRHTHTAGRHPSTPYPRPQTAAAQGPSCEELEARRIVIEAAIAYLQEARERDSKESAAIYEDLTRHYYKLLPRLQGGDEYHKDCAERERYLGLSLEALRIERGTAIRLRDEGRIND